MVISRAGKRKKSVSYRKKVSYPQSSSIVQKTRSLRPLLLVTRTLVVNFAEAQRPLMIISSNERREGSPVTKYM